MSSTFFVDGLGCSPTSLASGANGDALLAGCDLDNFPDVQFDVLALAAANGARLWFRGAVSALATDPFGNVVAGGSTDDGTHGFDFTVVKWGADGSATLVLPGPG